MCVLGASAPRRRGWSCLECLDCCYGNAGCVLGRGGGWELGTPRRSPHLRSLCQGAGGGPLAPPAPGARGRGDVGSLCSAPLQPPASPAPPSAAPSPSDRPGTPSLARDPGVQRGSLGTRGREGCRLTATSGADRGRSSLVRVGSQRLRLWRPTG